MIIYMPSVQKLVTANTKRNVRIKGYIIRSNFPCNLQRYDDDWKTLQVTEDIPQIDNQKKFSFLCYMALTTQLFF